MRRWERIEPPEPCASPDGHDHVDVASMRSDIPERVFCPRCHREWQIVTWDDDTP
jgi:hypothetical protein